MIDVLNLEPLYNLHLLADKYCRLITESHRKYFLENKISLKSVQVSQSLFKNIIYIRST